MRAYVYSVVAIYCIVSIVFWQHILPTLLCLEALSLLLIYFLPSTLNSQPMMTGPSMIIMLTVSISSASLGLSMLVYTAMFEYAKPCKVFS